MISITDLGLAFIEGLALIVSPCILPILPIILSAGITGGKTKPYGIILGFIIAFCAFTLLSQQLLQIFPIDMEILRKLSLILLLIFGCVLFSNYLSNKFSALTQSFAAAGEQLAARGSNTGGFWGGFLLGLPIGLIWTPCAGPIIAAVLVQTIRQQTHLGTLLNLVAFSLGVGLPMLLIATQGNRLINSMNFFKKHAEAIRKIAAVIIIITALLNWNESFFAKTFPSSSPLNNANTVVNSSQVSATPTMLLNGVFNPYPAPEISGIAAWINSPPLTIKQLRGKVVLIDFWTYSCINCIRTLPYIKSWYAKYHDQGLVIIGIHSPEFTFEQNLTNVQEAVKNDGIQYPVALDNNLDTWSNFNNEYWPAHYLIDKNGNVVYVHFGEGDYDVTENNIRLLLGKTLANNLPSGEATGDETQTPETYLGLARADRFASYLSTKNTYVLPDQLDLNQWGLSGYWSRGEDKITSQQKGDLIKLHFFASKVYLVMATDNNQPMQVTLLLNGKSIGQLTVDHATLYELVNLPSAQDGTLSIIANGPGLQAYSFTFGG